MTDTASVAAWYDANAEGEHGRLQQFGLEFAISLAAISQCIARIQRDTGAANLEILDLGGGTGRYSVALARQGHTVHYTDISAASVARGQAHAAAEGVALAISSAVDAVRLHEQPLLYGPARYDLVLCMGPLYHLMEQEERERVLEHCRYVTRKGGGVCVAFVTRWAHLRDLVRREPGRVVRERGFYEGYVGEGEKGGRYDRVPGRMGWHVSGGREAMGVVEGVGGLAVERVVACEGFLGGGLSAGLAVDDADVFQCWVEMCLRDSEKEEAWGASDHLLVVAKKVE